MLVLLLLIGGWCAEMAQGAGTWTPVAQNAPGSVALMLLLTDGTVLAHNSSGTAWYKLTPNSSGSYINGTWTTMAAMHDTRLYFSSDVLIDGRVFVAGGEYGIGGRTGEVYDPLSNSWTMTPVAGQNFVDSESKLLPSGKVLVAPVGPSPSGYTELFNPTTNTWTLGPKLYRGSSQDEASWVQLPDDSLITIDPYGTNSERYIPSSNTWINDAVVPDSLYNNLGELGAGFLLADGRAFFLGGTGHTAFYTPTGTTSPGAWAAGPDIPNGYGTTDAGAAMMVNGKILCTAGSATAYNAPSYFFEFDPVANTFTSINAPAGSSDNIPPYETNMLALPDGTVLYSNFGSKLYVYTPDGTPLAAGQPTITSITQNADASFHLTGTLLNGISEGAAYGDDGQMSTNFPIVRLTSSGGVVYYARTYNRSTTSVMTGSASMTTEFTLPPGLPAGTYSLVVAANGNASNSVSFTVAPIVVTVPASATEGSAPVNASVTLPSAPSANTVVNLVSNLPSRATVPASVTVLAGQTSASFQVTIIDDSILNGNQAAMISASASSYDSGSSNIVVKDNETAVLSVSPTSSYNPTGSIGGPFTPASTTYTLTNTGNTSLNWSIVKSVSWLTLSSSSGALAGGANTTVTVSTNATTNSEALGSYSGTLIFDNTTNGNGDTSVSVSLSVAPAIPSMTSPPIYTSGTSSAVSWSASSGASNYSVQISTVATFATVMATQSPTTTTATFTGLASGVTYYYRVAAVGSAATSGWSSVVSSTQDAGAPTISITSPAPGVTYLTTHATVTVQGIAADTISGVASVKVNGVAATTSDSFAHWTATVPLSSGTNTLTATATDNAQTTGNTASASISVTRNFSTQNDDLPDAWKVAHGLDPNSSSAVNGPLGDPDNDGLVNLLEYAFNANPQAAGVTPWQASLQTNSSDGLKYLTLSYPQIIGALDLTYSVEISTDLKTWSAAGSQMQQVSVTPNGDGVTQTVTVRILPAVSSSSGQFVRIQVTAQ